MKKQSTVKVKSLEGKLRIGSDMLELLLNYLVLMCVLTAAAGVFGAVDSPFCYWLIPVWLPFYYWFLRKKITYVSLFLLLHIPAAVMTGAVGFALKTNRIFWIVMLTVAAVIYTVNSVFVRVNERKGDRLPAGMALVIVVVAFFSCSYVRFEKGSNRILVFSLIYIFFMLIRTYLLYMADYLLTNKNAAGAMPEQAIVQLSIKNVILQSAAGVAALALLIWSPLANWMTQQAKNLGMLLLRGIAYLISLFISDEPKILPEEAMPEVASRMNGFAEAGEPTLLAKILQGLFYLLGFGIGMAFVVAIIVMLVKHLIEGFYENKELKKEVFVEGLLEEEERIGKKQNERRAKIPVLGGTSQQKIRRVFWKTVVLEYEKLGDRQPDRSQTARQFAERFGQEKTEEWIQLAELYEKARYADGEVTREDLKSANALARRVRR